MNAAQELLDAIHALWSIATPESVIAERLHISSDIVAFAIEYGTLPARELPVLWQPEPKLISDR